LASNKKRKSNPPVSADTATPVSPNPLGGGMGRDLSNWLFPAFLLMILLGVLVIWKFGSAAGNPNPVRAMFIAMNAATLSGFNTDPGVGGLNDLGQWTALLLIVGGSLFTMIVGGLAVIRIVRLPFTDRELIFAAFVAEAAALLIGASLLWDSDRSPFQAAFLAASAFGNCGLYLGNLPGSSNVLVHAVIVPLSILGGLGLPVLMEIWCAVVFRANFSAHSKTVIGASAWLYVIGLLLILALNQAGRGWPTFSGARDQLPSASVLAIESRTGGLPIAGISNLTQPARWFLIVLMMIGASPAGTGSGLKSTTLIELARGTRRLLSGQPPGRSFAVAFVWLVVYLALALAAAMLLAYVSGTDSPDGILFNAISAMSNVGFTVSPVPDEKGLFFAYAAIILVGRMAPLMVLWWMAETTPDAELAIG
jgi:trk system potassium uptake protein TrkH